MKKHTIYLLVIITFLMVSCNSKKVSEQQEFLSGYWVIESVTMPDGSTKKFGPTTSIDFVEITGDSGIRKKLMPKLDGTYRKFVGSEQFFLETKDDSLYLHYKTPYANWTEVVIEANAETSVLKNKGNRAYKYTRHEPTNLFEDE